MVSIAPFGTWDSPITPDFLVAGAVGLLPVALTETGAYWLESRPEERGRVALVRRTWAGEILELTPPPFNVRTTVHEYGGGACVVDGEEVFFANFQDQHWYQVTSAGIVPFTENHRYADGIVDQGHNRLICVQEIHEVSQAINTLVAVGDCICTLAAGHDFYSSPCLSPDGSQLAWLTWDHPQMPWDGTTLWCAVVQPDGSLGDIQKIAGGPTESIFQPQWSPEGVLHYVSDRTGWWNLYAAGEPVYPMAAEFGLPQWVFGQSTYGFTGDGRILCTFNQAGIWSLATLNRGHLEPITLPFTEIADLRVWGNFALFRAGSPQQMAVLVCLDLTTGTYEILRTASSQSLDRGYLSVPQPLSYPTVGGATAHGFFYPPQNQDYRAPEATLPPLLVLSHGGPTAATSSSLSWKIQYWTSRGFAVLDVNYGGSTGHGRPYRERLQGQWGVVDVADCVAGARYLAAQGFVDGQRQGIRGGSAGGYTTLCALTFTDQFQVGASYYGVSDLTALALDTHKFESRYLDGLVGPYPAAAQLYRARSPIHAADQLACPVIFFQGLEDKVVPPSQTETMVKALQAKGVRVAYLAFPGEQHGFRQAETIKQTLVAELAFYRQVLNLD